MWTVKLHPEFDAELVALPSAVQNEISAAARVLMRAGPQLGRPQADTLKGSRLAQLKEFRFTAQGHPWRLAYAFDPYRQAVFLVAASKSGVSQKLFYKRLIRIAEQRFHSHIISGDLS